MLTFSRRLTARERGSITVELAVLAPGLALLLLLLGAGARVVEVQGHIDGAAQDAARAASFARTPGDAQRFAQQAARADLGATSWCLPGTVQVPAISGFPQSGQVAVTVTCQADMSPFTVLGFGAAKTFHGHAVAPLDPFMCRGTRC